MSLSTITISTIDYVAYASVAEADAYLAVDPTRSATWAALTTDNKGKYLVAATRRLNLLSWKGEKSGGGTQADAWPRTGVSYVDGTAVTNTDVPLEVEQGTILLAGYIALKPTASSVAPVTGDKSYVRAGSAAVGFYRPTRDQRQLADDTAFEMVQPFIAGYTDTGDVGALAPGADADDVSLFEASDGGFGMSGGL